ncbi:MAG: hypothetical protein WBX11_00705 [Thiobacillaceae bacterium]
MTVTPLPCAEEKIEHQHHCGSKKDFVYHQQPRIPFHAGPPVEEDEFRQGGEGKGDPYCQERNSNMAEDMPKSMENAVIKRILAHISWSPVANMAWLALPKFV